MLSGGAAALGALTRLSTGPFAIHPRNRSVAAAAPLPPAAEAKIADASLDPRLLRRALAALETHAKAIRHRDRIAIVDFSAPSSDARLHFLDVASGRVSRLLVAQAPDPTRITPAISSDSPTLPARTPRARALF